MSLKGLPGGHRQRIRSSLDQKAGEVHLRAPGYPWSNFKIVPVPLVFIRGRIKQPDPQMNLRRIMEKRERELKRNSQREVYPLKIEFSQRWRMFVERKNVAALCEIEFGTARSNRWNRILELFKAYLDSRSVIPKWKRRNLEYDDANFNSKFQFTEELQATVNRSSRTRPNLGKNKTNLTSRIEEKGRNVFFSNSK